MSRYQMMVTGFSLFLVMQVASAASQKPNIVFFFSDDLTTQAISAYQYGMDLPPTPNIDRLAREGMLFENSFCGNNICTPSRGAVMTGLHSHKNGIVHLGGALDPDRQSWPKMLHQNGYTTAVFGKWHMKTKPNGFDAWEVFSGQGNYYNPDLFGPKGSRRIPGHSTDVVTDLALDWLAERDTSKPFCPARAAQGASPKLETQYPRPAALPRYHLPGTTEPVRRVRNPCVGCQSQNGY